MLEFIKSVINFPFFEESVVGVAGYCIAMWKCRYEGLKENISRIEKKLDKISDYASYYWMNITEQDDAKEKKIENDLMDLSVEVFWIHREYKIFSENTLVRLNKYILLKITEGMGPDKSICPIKASHSSRYCQIYRRYLSKELAKKTRLFKIPHLAS